MRRPPSLRFLGVEPGSPPRRLLGLPDPASGEDPSPEAIDAALARQRARIDRHPAGREPEADLLRRELAAAAAALRTRAAARPAMREPRGLPAVRPDDLTEFDRLVLATLATEGGWNARSRARLVAIAARYGVSSAGLVRVVEAISRSARAGGLGARRERLAGAVAELASLRGGERGRFGEAVARLDAALAREVRGESAGGLLRLTLVFVAVAALAMWLFVRTMTAGDREAAPRPPTPAEVAERERLERPPETPVRAVADPKRPAPVAWSRRPLLRGGEVPEESLASAAAAGEFAERLARLGRKLQLSPSRPSEADRREWRDLARRIGGAWPLVDPSVRSELLEGTLAALRPLEDDRIAEEFLAALPVEGDLALEPLGPWRGAFHAGILAECAARPSMPPAVAALAADRLVAAMPRRVLAADRGGTAAFDLGAGAWLDRAIPTLVAGTPGDPRAAARWNRWFAAQRAVRGEAGARRATLEAIDAALRDPKVDPVPEGDGSDLLGTLVAEMDWTARSPVRGEARQALVRWLADDRLAPPRLWALTSLLDHHPDAPWFVPEFVLAPDADAAARQGAIVRIAAAWPEDRTAAVALGGGIPVEPRLLERFRAVRTRVESLPAHDAFTRLRATLAASWLNAIAVALAAGDAEVAGELFREIDEAIAADPAVLARTGVVAGRAAGSDGEFAAIYQQAGRDADRQREQLRNLRMRAGAGDLGPVDAALLVGEALRASDPATRGLAVDVIADRFPSGPTILTELLDQLPMASQNESLSELLQRLTGTPLPHARDPDWMRAARLALVRAIRRLEQPASLAPDPLADRYAESIDARARLFRLGHESNANLPPDAALGAHVRQWRTRAGSLFLSEPFPATLEELDRRAETRRALASGPIQRCAAEAIALVELVAAVAVAEEPPIKPKVAEILAESSERRGRAGSALGQLLEAERAIAAILERRFRPATREDAAARRGGGDA